MKSRHEDKDTIVHNAGNVLENNGCPSAQANICLSINVAAKLWRLKEKATGLIRRADAPALEG